MVVTCAYVLVSQGGVFQLNADNEMLMILVTKNRSEYNSRRSFL